MKNKTYTVYTFAELSGPARQRAIDDHRQFIAEQWDGETTIEDAKQMLAFSGFDVGRVFYSGFSNQGDGACFEGSWRASDVAAPAMKDNAPEDKELHRIADGMAAIAALYPLASFSVTHKGRYSHEYCTDFDFNEGDGPELAGDDAAKMIELARDAMRWIYRQLEKEYDYQTAEAQVIESIEANGYEFTEDGRID